MHAFAVPQLGVKMDAIAGRLNAISLYRATGGEKFGICSELCGVGHGHIPIQVEFVRVTDFVKWLKIENSLMELKPVVLKDFVVPDFVKWFKLESSLMEYKCLEGLPRSKSRTWIQRFLYQGDLGRLENIYKGNNSLFK
jgi:hypothetical protein